MSKKFCQTEVVSAGRRLGRRYLGAALTAGILSLTLFGCGVEDSVNASTPTFTLTTFASPQEGGSVSRSPDQSSYYRNKDVTVTAMANDGYTFTGWSGASQSTNPTITVKVTDHTTLTANFKKTDGGGVTPPPGGGGTSYSLNVSASPSAGGRISIDPDQTSYKAETEVTATATPNAGYEFVGWSGASTSQNKTIKVIMNKDISLTANFQKTDDGGGAATFYALTAAAVPAAGGSVTLSPNKDNYSVGEQVTAAAEPKDGYKFTGWSGASESTEPTVTITMNADKALVAAFEKINTGGDPVTPAYTLTAIASPTIGGTVSRNPNKDEYDAGAQVTVTATAAAGYVFTGWAEASSAKTSPVTITMDKSKVLIANFEKQADVPISYTLTVNASPTEGGSVSRNPSTTSYNAGATVSVSATAASGYTFTGWSGASTSKTSPVTITMDANKTLTANFEKQAAAATYTLTVNASPTDGGTVLRNPGKAAYNAGESVSVTATPSSGYKFTGWSGASTSTNAAITVTMDANKTLTANFTQSTAGWRTLNDFDGGRTENYFGVDETDVYKGWYVWTYNDLPANAITSESVSFDDKFGNYSAVMNALSGGRSGSNDYSAGIVYTKVLDIPQNAYPGVGVSTRFSLGTLTDVDTISFWLKGTTPSGVNLRFELQDVDDESSGSNYRADITGVTETWKQYKIRIYPITNVRCPSSTATGSGSSTAGDLYQGSWVPKCFEFKPERITQFGWGIEFAGGYSGNLYIDDIQLHYAK